MKDALPGAFFAAVKLLHRQFVRRKHHRDHLIVILQFSVNLFILILYKERYGISADSPCAHLKEEEWLRGIATWRSKRTTGSVSRMLKAGRVVEVNNPARTQAIDRMRKHRANGLRVEQPSEPRSSSCDSKSYILPGGQGSSLFLVFLERWLSVSWRLGVIHIESPTQKDYPLGSFFDEWSQRFSSLGYPSTLDVTTGWQIWINGKPYTGNFRTIPLTAHELITLAYNSPGVKPDTSYSWNGL